jgi:cystathionine beta-synthase
MTTHRDSSRANCPEIWGTKQVKLLHFVVGVGTGGTISKLENTQRKPNIKLWGIDTYGSVFKKIP